MTDKIPTCPKCNNRIYYFYNSDKYQCSECNYVYGKEFYVKTSSGELELAPKNNILEAKPDMSLLPLDLLEYEVRPYEYGLIKYSRNSWRKGFLQSVMLAASLRHIGDYKDKGQMFDPDAKEKANMDVHHIAAAIFCLRCVMDSIINHPELDDRYIREVKDE